MHASATSRFRAFTEPLEGVVRHMYLDVKGLVTTGVGNLIDPVGQALVLPFRWKDQASNAKRAVLASQQEIMEEWNSIKNNFELASKGHRACKGLTRLELSDESIDQLIKKRLASNEAFLKKHKSFAAFDEWPADAQLGLMSMAWAAGANLEKTFPKFSAACGSMDFEAAAERCKLREQGNAGVIPRNRANQHLFRNAAAVLAGEPDGFYVRATLYYPQTILKPVRITADEAAEYQ